MRVSIRSSGPFTARPPISGLTATERTARAASASRIARHRKDGVDGDVRVAGRDDDRIRTRERLDDPGAGDAASAPS